jgi:hypothetical protein
LNSARERRQKRFGHYLEGDGIIEFDETVAASAADLFRRLGRPRKRAADVAIAATALVGGLARKPSIRRDIRAPALAGLGSFHCGSPGNVETHLLAVSRDDRFHSLNPNCTCPTPGLARHFSRKAPAAIRHVALG